MLLLLFCVCVVSPATAQKDDPWREMNERLFRLNDYFDLLVVRPAATGYTLFIPRIAGRELVISLAMLMISMS